MFKKPDCRITFYEGKHLHRHKLIDRNKNISRYPTFFSDEDITGKVEFIKNSSSFDYSSITIGLIGQVDNYIDQKYNVTFLSLKKDISKNGSLTKDITPYNFTFNKVKLPYESYKGDSIGVKYAIKVNIINLFRTISYEEEFVVVKPNEESILKKNDEPISMNVGLKDLFSILIEFEHVNYGIHGTLKGFVSFGKLGLSLTKMELQLIKKETIFGHEVPDLDQEPKIITTFELMDGEPFRNNETIPFRFFLQPYHLTPSYTNVAGNFSVRYFLNLVIMDDKNNRYYKQKEIFLYRLYITNKKNTKYNHLNNKSGSKINYDIDHLKDLITEPIDYGDYFSVFNNLDDENDNKKQKMDIKEPEPDDFYFKSCLTGFSLDENEENKNKNENKDDIIMKTRRSNTTTVDVRKNKIPVLNEKIINRSILNSNIFSRSRIFKNNNNNDKLRKSKSDTEKFNFNYNVNKNVNKNNQVINIQENNKFKNNDILINDNYYNKDSHIMYENSYNKAFNDKLKQKRMKYSSLSDRIYMDDDDDDNDNDDEDEKERERENDDDKHNQNDKDINDDKDIVDDVTKTYDLMNSNKDNNLSSINSINEPFSNNLIMSNFPSNYSSIGLSGDFGQNVMGSKNKKK